jgi:putative membrane protein
MLELLSLGGGCMPLLAQLEPVVGQAKSDLLVYHFVAAAIFSAFGIIVLFLSIFLMEKLTPQSITKEIIDEHNTAVATIVSAIVIGISIIIAASIMG